ncbi:hypothetical protein HNR71_001524 [Kribbella sandramycini]|uniref:Uncharacterized protein n=1 Tax=Kribbella sandramycini TaxID=60450 RepID=A0A841S575_9ACTN|nr:hypothetical protein [Kribbella sandramycini]MBB6565887.1 hypothetical protein [Kribbella sandramycini]
MTAPELLGTPSATGALRRPQEQRQTEDIQEPQNLLELRASMPGLDSGQPGTGDLRACSGLGLAQSEPLPLIPNDRAEFRPVPDRQVRHGISLSSFEDIFSMSSFEDKPSLSSFEDTLPADCCYCGVLRSV